MGSQPTYHGMGRTNHASRRKAKALKASAHKPRFALGHDVFMDRVESLCRRTLIGRLKYISMSKDGWVDWATLHWKPIIHYVPAISILVRGWIVFVFHEDEHASSILNRPWRVGKGSLVLDRWHVNFDLAHERIKKRHL